MRHCTGGPVESPICWAEPDDSLMLGPELVRQTTEKVALIRERILAAQSRQKSHADKRRRPLEFQVGDSVMLKVSSMKGVQRFGRRGKLAPRYIGPFRILERIGAVSYRLDLPASMSSIHNVFHISMHKKHLHDGKQQRVLDASEF